VFNITSPDKQSQILQ